MDDELPPRFQTAHPKYVRPMRYLLDVYHIIKIHRWRQRYVCHHSIVCCQHTDLPNCN